MSAPTLKARVVMGLGVALVVVAAVSVAVVAVTRGVAAISAGLGERALQLGGFVLVSIAVAVAVLALYSHWLTETPRPRTDHGPHVPSRWEALLVGTLLTGLVVGIWPVLASAYQRCLESFGVGDYAWAVGYAVAGLFYAWFVGFSLERYVRWLRLRQEGAGAPQPR